MTFSWRTSLAVFVAAVVAASVVGCAGPRQSGGDADDESSAMAAFAAASPDEQLGFLDESAKALDGIVAKGLGLDTALEVDAAVAAAVLLQTGEVRAPAPELWVTGASFTGSDTTRTAADAGTSPALPAFHDIGAMLAVLGEALFGTDGGQVAHGASPEGASPQTSYEFNQGSASGVVTESETSTHRGITVDHTIGTRFQADACPTDGGRAGGAVTITSASTVTTPSGTAVRTRLDVDFAFDIQVDDQAFADSLLVESEALMLTGAPGSALTVPDPTDSTAAKTTVSFSFGSGGAASMVDYAGSATTAVAFDRSVEDLTAKTALRLAAQLEDYWRSGACVEVAYDHPQEVAQGSTTDLGVAPLSRVDELPIEGGTFSVDSFAGSGSVTPAEGEHPNPTTFSWKAPSGPGSAEIGIMSTSKRGIGLDTTTIEVLRAWEVTGVKDGAEHYGIKCDGLEGSWTVDATGDFGFGYTAHIEFELDSSLVGPYTATMTANGHTLGDSGEIWFEKVDDEHYILHSSSYDTTLDVTPTDACAS